jgi:hypothetical protein
MIPSRRPHTTQCVFSVVGAASACIAEGCAASGSAAFAGGEGGGGGGGGVAVGGGRVATRYWFQEMGMKRGLSAEYRPSGIGVGLGGGGGRRIVTLLARLLGVIGGALGLKHQTIHGWRC